LTDELTPGIWLDVPGWGRGLILEYENNTVILIHNLTNEIITRDVDDLEIMIQIHELNEELKGDKECRSTKPQSGDPPW
jgi:hypothetical protein